jgi:hypothetical protein
MGQLAKTTIKKVERGGKWSVLPSSFCRLSSSFLRWKKISWPVILGHFSLVQAVFVGLQNPVFDVLDDVILDWHWIANQILP